MKKKVLIAMSGGVDSAVAATLIHRAAGDNLTCVFVDHGLLRKYEADEVMSVFKDKLGMNLIKADAAGRCRSAATRRTARSVLPTVSVCRFTSSTSTSFLRAR